MAANNIFSLAMVDQSGKDMMLALQQKNAAQALEIDALKAELLQKDQALKSWISQCNIATARVEELEASVSHQMFQEPAEVHELFSEMAESSAAGKKMADPLNDFADNVLEETW